METTETRHSFKLATRLAVGLAAAILMLLTATFEFKVAAAEELTLAAKPVQPLVNEPDMLADITFTGAITEDDVAYFRASLEMLHEVMPVWQQYIMDAKPLTLSVDPVQGMQGRAAIAKCCDTRGHGVITFGHHFGTLAVSDDADSQSSEAKRITFLGVLVHEITHVLDQRAGRFATKTDRKTCVAAESSGLSKQVEFKQNAASVALTADIKPSASFRQWLDLQIQSEIQDLRDRSFWDLYCGDLAQKPGY